MFNDDLNFPLTEEQTEIFEYILTKINSKETLRLGVFSLVGDGKTTLFERIISHLRIKKEYKEYLEKFDSKILNFNNLLIIDDFDKLPNDEQLKLTNSKYRIIVIFYSNKNKIIKLKFDEKILNNKYRLKYLQISNPLIYSAIRNFESLSFSNIKVINNELEKNYSNYKEIDLLDRYEFFQKKIELIYGKSWEDFKKTVYKNCDTFPIIKDYDEQEIENWFKKGWIFNENNKIIFSNVSQLSVLLLRKNISELKSGNLIKKLEPYKNEKCLQYSIIKFYEKQNLDQKIEFDCLYLSSLILINCKSVTLDIEKLDFDLNSVLDIFNLFKNKELFEKIPTYFILNNLYKIKLNQILNNDDCIYLVKNFTDLQKLIIVSLQICLENINWKIFTYINYELAISEINNILEKDGLNVYSLFFLLYVCRIIQQRITSLNLDKVIEKITKKISNILDVNINNSNELRKFITDIKLDQKTAEALDAILYHIDKSNFLESTSISLSELFNDTKLIDKYKNPYLKKFNLLVFKIFVNLTENNHLLKWIDNNWKKIFKIQYGLTSFFDYEEYISAYYKEDFYHFTIIKDSILFSKNTGYYNGEYGYFLEDKQTLGEPEYWKDIKKDIKKECWEGDRIDFVTKNSFDINDFIENFIVKQEDKIYWDWEIKFGHLRKVSFLCLVIQKIKEFY